jgi:hypothetical protein
MDFTAWVRHFERNAENHRALEAQLAGMPDCTLDAPTRKRFAHSLQRFELGESGDGEHLLAKAASAGDPTYERALALLVAEEQRHSRLFGRALRHLGGTPLQRHWSDTAFSLLRRACGLRTELGLFLVAESVATGYFATLAVAGPDPVVRAVARRVEQDERDHLRFQVDGLARACAGRGRLVRGAARFALLTVGAGAAVVLALDHRGALRACGRRPSEFALSAVRFLGQQLDLALSGRRELLGPRSAPVRAA